MGKKSSKKGGSSSRSRNVEQLEEFPGVIFVTETQKERFIALAGKRMVPTRFIDRSFLARLGILRAVEELLIEIGFTLLNRMREHTYRSLTLEFLSSLDYDAHSGNASFRLLNTDVALSREEIADIFGFTKNNVLMKPSNAFVPEAVWTSITGFRNVSLSALRVSQIEHPVLRFCLRLIAGTFFGRTDPGKANKLDLILLGSAVNMQHLEPLNFDCAKLVFEHFVGVATGRISTIAIGGIITYIAKAHLGFDEVGFTPLVPLLPLLDREYLTTRSTKWVEPSRNEFRWLLHSDRWIILPSADLPPIRLENWILENRPPTASYILPRDLLRGEDAPEQPPQQEPQIPISVPNFASGSAFVPPSAGPSFTQEQSAPFYQTGPSYDDYAPPGFSAPPSYGQGFDPHGFEARRHAHEMINQNLVNYNHYSSLMSQGFGNQAGPHPTYWQGQANYPGTVFQEYGVDPTQWGPGYGQSYGGAGGQWLGGASGSGFGGGYGSGYGGDYGGASGSGYGGGANPDRGDDGDDGDEGDDDVDDGDGMED